MITAMQLDTLKELINIGVGRAGSILSELVNAKVQLLAPDLGMCRLDELSKKVNMDDLEQVYMVDQAFMGHCEGKAMLLFPPESGDVLVSRLLSSAGSATDSSLDRESTLLEVGNIIINSIIGSLSNLLDDNLSFTLPVYHEVDLPFVSIHLHKTSQKDKDECFVLYSNACFNIADLNVSGTIVLLFDASAFEVLLRSLDALAVEDKR